MNLESLKGKLIVSCQSVDGEPLNDKYIVAKMANACVIGGATVLRMSQIDHILEAKKYVNVPIIGLVKQHYPDSPVFITPTMKEIQELVEVAKVDVVALDATFQKRPNNLQLDQLFKEARKKYPHVLFMADCSTLEEVKHAQELGFDLVASTLRGHTEETQGRSNLENDYEFIKLCLENTTTPFIAEGGVWTPEQAREILDLGVYAVVVGSAITRPHLITKWWLDQVFKKGLKNG